MHNGNRTPFSGTEKRNDKRLLAFGWYGGKYSHLEWLLPLLPLRWVRTNTNGINRWLLWVSKLGG